LLAHLSLLQYAAVIFSFLAKKLSAAVLVVLALLAIHATALLARNSIIFAYCYAEIVVAVAPDANLMA
jgi:hypothetical protein